MTWSLNDVLNTKGSDAKEPKFPAGEFTARVVSAAAFEAQVQNETIPKVRIRYRLISPTDDNDGEYNQDDMAMMGEVSQERSLTERGFPYTRDFFIKSLGLEEEFVHDSFPPEWFESVIGSDVIVVVTQTPSKNGGAPFINVKTVRPV